MLLDFIQKMSEKLIMTWVHDKTTQKPKIITNSFGEILADEAERAKRNHFKDNHRYDPCTPPIIKLDHFQQLKQQNQFETQRLDEKENRQVKFTHDRHVIDYRKNMTDKCPIEVEAAKDRATRGVPFGSPEHSMISRICVSDECKYKYHWCPTCFLAPRCSCLMPHYAPIFTPYGVSWVGDQMAYYDYFSRLACDERYGTFVLTFKEIANGKIKGPFCKECTDMIYSKHIVINKIFGRTYLEQAHHLWAFIGKFMCEECTETINWLPCMNLGMQCPSFFIPLISQRLLNYKSRPSVETVDSGFLSTRSLGNGWKIGCQYGRQRLDHSQEHHDTD